MSTTIVTVGGRSRLVHPAEVPPLGCIEIDIPWLCERGGGQIKRGADAHYPLMPTWQAIETIIRSPLWKPDRERGVHVWLWVTNTALAQREPYVVADALGIRPVSFRTWLKDRMGTGQYMRGITEHLMLCVAGPACLPEPGPDPVTTALIAPKGRHSEKPPEAIPGMARVSPGPRAEIFARQPREGWYGWGNDPALVGACGANNPISLAAKATGGHTPDCTLGMGDGEEIWTCVPGCPATRPRDLVRLPDGSVVEQHADDCAAALGGHCDCWGPR